MTDYNLFHKLFNGGNYSLPWLIKFSNDDTALYFVNALEDVSYDGNVYKAASFQYTPPELNGSGGSLNISLVDNSLLELLDASSDSFRIDVTGVMLDSNEIEPVHIYTHMSASASWDSSMTLNLSLNQDERLSMTFPPYTFDTDNNRGGN